MRFLSRFAPLIALGLVVAPELAAQSSPGSVVTVVPRGGWVRFSEATSMESSTFLGFEALYRLTPWLQVGPAVTIAQPSSNGDDFPAAFTYGDTTFLYKASQPVTMFDVGAVAHATLPTFGRLQPYALGGVGYYTLYMDPQVTGADRRYGRASFQLGGGADVRITESSGIRLDVRDLMFNDFDREVLNPVRSNFDAYSRFAGALPARTESTRGLKHNLVLSLGFTFTPSRGGEEDNQ